MKKIPLKDLQPNEIIRRLKAGEILKEFKSKNYVKVINDVICTFYENGDISINDNLIFNIKNEPLMYFEEPEELKLEVGKCYWTRDERKAFISCYIADIDRYLGIICGEKSVRTWSHSGLCSRDNSDKDLVSEWNDDDVEEN